MSLSAFLAFAFAAPWVALFFVRTESFGRALPLYRPAEQIVSVVTRVVLTLHISLGCFLTNCTDPLPPLRAALGTFVYFAGVCFWLWARTAISPWRARPLPDQPPLRFRRDGPFAWVRNPLYFGLLLSSTALVIVTAQPLLLFTLVACGILLDSRARQDEARLHQQLGAEYAAYCLRVKRLIPFVW